MTPPSEEGKEKEAFQKIKETLMWAPALRLPDTDKPFQSRSRCSRMANLRPGRHCHSTIVKGHC